MSSGRIVEIIGAVIDVELSFSGDSIYRVWLPVGGPGEGVDSFSQHEIVSRRSAFRTTDAPA